jgi:hypothetical protein
VVTSAIGTIMAKSAGETTSRPSPTFRTVRSNQPARVHQHGGPARGAPEQARQLLEFAEQRAAQAADWLELHNALFGLGGKANELFALVVQLRAVV